MNACSVPFVVAKLKQLTKPGVVVLGLLHHLGALLPLVRLRLLLVVLVRLAHHLGLDMYEQICLVYGLDFVFLQVS